MGISEEITKFMRAHESPVLFAGAGVSAKAGVPTWGSYLAMLAEFARQFDIYTYHIMMERIREGAFTDAASYYFMCRKIPEAEKYKTLNEPLRGYDHTKVLDLVSLPFTAFITTNYDRVLDDAFAHTRKVAAVGVQLGDPTLKSAPYSTDIYIARIHGRSEVPETMVLDSDHYEKLKENTAYIDYLRHIFTRRQILFVGFSFLDPAIRTVLEAVRVNVGRVHDGRHHALLPTGSDCDFLDELERYNISKTFYDPSDNHADLWAGISSANKNLTEKIEPDHKQSLKTFALNSAHQYLAACYCRTQLGSRLNPLRNAVAEGIIGHYLIEQGSKGATTDNLIDKVREHLSLSNSDATNLVGDAIGSLLKDGLCNPSGTDSGAIVWTGKENDSYDSAIDFLVNGSLNRFVVREAGVVSKELKICLKSFFEKLILLRGWDLGAAFAANRPPEYVDVLSVMRDVELCHVHGLASQIVGVSRAVSDLIKNPSIDESKYLAELGRVSFALELVIQSPHDYLFHKLTLPQRVYLDANVLMPALTVGHPYHEIYKGTIDNLLDAGSRSLVSIHIAAYSGFLNEVVSHRRLAIDEFGQIDKLDLATLRRKSLLEDTTNMNVFIGAYANLFAKDNNLSFEMFLKKYAPYETEADLKRWLVKQGISVLNDREMQRNTSDYPNILHALEIGYADSKTWKYKDARLVRHDAIQLAALNEDAKVGIKSLFVSADKRLRDVISGSSFSGLANHMVSHVGLTQLIDLLIGNPVESQGLSRILWAGKLSDKTEQIRNYLIDIALDEYDDAIAMEMNKVVDTIAEDIIIDAENESIEIPPHDTQDEKKLTQILGTYENKFFRIMRELIENRRGNQEK